MFRFSLALKRYLLWLVAVAMNCVCFEFLFIEAGTLQCIRTKTKGMLLSQRFLKKFLHAVIICAGDDLEEEMTSFSSRF